MTAAETAKGASLVSGDGQIDFGIYPDTLAHINGRDYDYRRPMGNAASAWQRRFHYKQFQYFGVVSDRFLAGCAFADTAWIGLVFVYVFDTRSGKLHEYTWRSPLARELSLSDSPLHGESSFRRGSTTIRLGYNDSAGSRTKTLTVDTPELKIEASMTEPAHYQPMSLCTRIGINGWAYANKVAGLPVTGRLRFGGEDMTLEALDAFGHHDFSAGFMRRETFWNWACLSGKGGARQVGMNLSCGVNETSFTENCLWLDGKLIKVDGTTFVYDRDDLMRPWKVTSIDGQVTLTFRPMGRHRERVNLGLFASNFHQIFGTFHGTLQVDGETLDIDGIHGFVEEQYAKW